MVAHAHSAGFVDTVRGTGEKPTLRRFTRSLESFRWRSRRILRFVRSMAAQLEVRIPRLLPSRPPSPPTDDDQPTSSFLTSSLLVFVQDAIELRTTGSRKELYEALRKRHVLVVHEDGSPARTQSGLLVLASMSLVEQPDRIVSILMPALRRHEVRSAFLGKGAVGQGRCRARAPCGQGRRRARTGQAIWLTAARRGFFASSD